FKSLRPPTSTLFPYTTLFRSMLTRNTINLPPSTCTRNKKKINTMRWFKVNLKYEWGCLGNIPSCGTIIFCFQQISDGWTQESSRSEEHTSELQSRSDLVCRLL